MASEVDYTEEGALVKFDERKLRQSGGSCATTIPAVALECFGGDIGEQVLQYINAADNELIIADNGMSTHHTLCGSRNLRTMGETAAITITPDALESLEYEIGQTVTVAIDPVNRNLHFRF